VLVAKDDAGFASLTVALKTKATRSAHAGNESTVKWASAVNSEACDFFSKKVWTLGGLVEYFVLFLIQPGTRQVLIAGITANPDGAWMTQQARNLGMFFADQPEQAKYLVCDRDTKFTEQFQAIPKSEGMDTVQTAVRAPCPSGKRV
jgi:hypothetical protein